MWWPEPPRSIPVRGELLGWANDTGRGASGISIGGYRAKGAMHTAVTQNPAHGVVRQGDLPRRASKYGVAVVRRVSR